MSSETIVIPQQLAVLPLPYPFILHPSLLLSIPLSYAHSLNLLKAALQTHAAAAKNESGGNNGGSAKDRPIIVACLPTLRAPAGSSARPTPPSQQRSVVPHNSSSSGDNNNKSSTIRLNDLAEWGTAARLLRLTRHPASQTCTLLVTGLARIRVDRFLSSRVTVTLPSTGPPPSPSNSDGASPSNNSDVAVPLAAITVFAEGVDPYLPSPRSAPASAAGPIARKPLGQEAGDALLIKELRTAATDILDALSSLPIFQPANGGGNGQSPSASNTILPVSLLSGTGNGVIGTIGGGNVSFGAGGMPLLPPVMLKRLRSLVKDTPDAAMGTLADVLVGTLGGACEWAARLDLLSEWDLRSRLSAASRALRNGASRVLLTRELLSSLAAPLNQGSKETLLRQQLESLLTSLVAVNPNVSARITTPNGGFSINGSSAPTGGSDAAGNNGKNRGVITIRSGGGSGNGSPDAARIINSIRNGSNPFRGQGGPGSGSGNPFSGAFGSGGSSGNGGSAGGAAGGDDSEADDIAELAAKLDKAMLTPEARKACEKELKRLQRIPQQSVERGVVITYLEIMAELPWERTSVDLSEEEMVKVMKRGAHVDEHAEEEKRAGDEGIVERARRILDEDHYGLEKIKKRLVEYLAVLELKTIQAEEKLDAELKVEEQAALVKKGDTGGADGSGGAGSDAETESPSTASDTLNNFNSSVMKIEDAADPTDRSKDYERGQGFRHMEDVAEDESRRVGDKEESRRQRKKISIADKGPILLLVGPPGTGKTSIAKSLATALRRPFTRLSLGGVRDEAEIRGHRRTYVGSMPGSIVSALRKVGVSDPVILLDEVDKLGSGNGMHGDPMAAMLEVLDPEQNHNFNDHYVNCPIDLSKVLFIATANSLDTISPPLLDRTEVIQVSGYTHDEKVAIARQYLLPKQIKAQGLKQEDLQVSDDVLLKVAMSYTREAGVRTLERQIGAIARAKAVEYAEVKKGAKDKEGKVKVYDPVVHVDQLEKLLGIETYDPEVAETQSRPGVATGLAYQGSGSGGILHIESVLLPPGNGHLKLTGSLGDVIRESAELALSWVKAHAFQLGIISSRDSEFPKNDIHLHLPSGAIPKDGPSAGVAMTCALVSLFTRTPISPTTAMTGEITLRGQVTPVGGIKEKCLGAHRAGIKMVMLPARNRKDIEADLPANVKAELQVVYIKTIWQALEHAFGHALFAHTSGNREGVEEGRRMMFELEQSRL